MKYFLLFLTIVLATFLQAVVVNFNFLLILVLFCAITLSPAIALAVAFISGVVLDLILGGTLGLSSLGFVLPIFLLLLYRQRFSFQNHFIVGIFAAIAYLTFALLTHRVLNLLEGAILVILVVIFRVVWPSVFQPNTDQRIVR